MKTEQYKEQGVGFQGFPTATTKRSPRFFVFIIILCILGSAIYYVVYRDGFRKKEQPVTSNVKLVTIVTTVPTKVLETKINKSELRISILNGSGMRGKAQEIADYLESKEYTNITIGNADRFTYQDITLRIKSEKRAALTVLLHDLREYKVASTAVDMEEFDRDVQIIVGR